MLHPLWGKYNYRGICRKGRTLQGICDSARESQINPNSPETKSLQFVYFCGAGGTVGAGAGCVLTGWDFKPCRTEVGPPRLAA
jgi:hypothetical protein